MLTREGCTSALVAHLVDFLTKRADLLVGRDEVSSQGSQFTFEFLDHALEAACIGGRIVRLPLCRNRTLDPWCEDIEPCSECVDRQPCIAYRPQADESRIPAFASQSDRRAECV